MAQTHVAGLVREDFLGTGTSANARGGARQSRLAVVLALLALYVVWGSTYLANQVALGGFPPLLMSGVRFLVAGGVLYGLLRAGGARAPARGEWAGAAVVGVLLLVGGSGGAAFAQQWVASGLAAIGMATIPVWTALFAGIWDRRPSSREWAGLVAGFAGVVLLNIGGDLRASPIGAAALLLAAASWGVGSIWSRHLALPSGLVRSAAEMLIAGAVLLVSGLLAGERVEGWPGWPAMAALGYLVVFGSLVAYSAYTYLLRTVRPALATSYAYVNPVVAVVLGVTIAGERITGPDVAAMLIILLGVGLLLRAQGGPGPPPAGQSSPSVRREGT
jgi:drug/metabolite transporter (DMT)-like permease